MLVEDNGLFIKVSNELFKYEKEGRDYFPVQMIGTEGLTILCYLIMKQGNRSFTQETINRMMTFLKSEHDGFKSKTTVLVYLKVLERNGYIEIVSKSENIHLNEEIIIKVNQNLIKKENFTMMSESLFMDKFKYIGHIGWSILCYLSRLHNYSYGGYSADYGYANPSEDHISNVLGIGITSVKKYLGELEYHRLIKICPQNPVYLYKDKYGRDKYDYQSNHYKVYSRIPDHAYYLKELDKQIEKILIKKLSNSIENNIKETES